MPKVPKTFDVDGLADVSWPSDVDPENWRNMPDPDGDVPDDDDEDRPVPDYVISAIGFDPMKEEY